LSRIGCALTALLVILAPGCRAAVDDSEGGSAEVEAAAVGTQQLRLYDRGEGCAVRLGDGEEVALGLPGPCAYLHRNGASTPTVHHYAGVGHVVIVSGAPAEQASYRADDWAKPEDRCSSHAQGVVVGPAGVRLGQVQQSRVSYCPRIGLDEKSYYGVAHQGD